MEYVFEFLFSFYIELMLLIVPEEKRISKKYRSLAIFMGLTGLLTTLALFVLGCVLIVDYGNNWGLLSIAVSVVISIAQIITGFILHDKKSKK